MSFLTELKTNRLSLLKLFLGDQELVDLVSNETGHQIPAFDLQFEQIFPYKWIDNTVSDTRVFLCFSLASRAQSDLTKKTLMRVWVFMHKDLMRMSDCIRQDAILSRVDELLNGNEGFGVSDVVFSSCDDISGLPKDYYGGYVEYYVKNINKITCR